MALEKSILETSIKAVLDKQAAKKNENDSPEVSRQELASELATVIDAYIKTATVNVVGVQVGPGTAVGTLI